ncbi:hypothetical protein STRPO_0788 [Streptococcus porcinus str. Jelinkova 176]|uniref:Bacteriocin n=1 Tax=Streptococcus porcinus str. Jelinkova 176 TaxID=873448 RepID=A0ABN0CTQ9_STRPO|nr:hypothetical protein STRPO_0788 [Streptococcus porcinus str. Jelinkova 176]
MFSRYPNGEWGYVVTKGNFEVTKDVIVNGWISSLGGGYFNPGYKGEYYENNKK